MKNVKTFFYMFSQITGILNAKQKRMAVLVAIVAIGNALFETLGASVILPFILALLQPEKLLKYPFVDRIVSFWGIKSIDGLVAFSAIGIVCVYIIKNVFVLLFNYIQLRFRNGLEKDLSVLMFDSYISRPYAFFVETNSAQILQGITGDVAATSSVVDCFCNLMNEGLTCVLLGGLLVLISPIMAISLLGLAGITALIIVFVLKKRISIYGTTSRRAFTDRYKASTQTIGGIKEIIVTKRQKSFAKKYNEAAETASKVNTSYLWRSKLPSRVIETVFMTGLIVLILFNYKFSDDKSLLIAQFGALGVAALRILPAITSLSNSLNSLIYYRPSLENAYENIKQARTDNSIILEKIDDDKNRFCDSIKIDNIYWKYSDNLPNVIEGLSMEIFAGEAVGFIGESGAGKTTLADIILGLYEPQNGKIFVDGKNIFDVATKWHQMIGYVPQTVFLLDDTIRNNVVFGLPTPADDTKIWEAISKAQLTEFVTNLKDGLDTILGERGVKISGGQRQRIAIARALYYDPDILVLDEATSALDNDTEKAVIEAINALQGDKTLIIVAHRLSTIEKCDRIFKIQNGKAILQ